MRMIGGRRMKNNTKPIRLALMLTPQQAADRLGVDADRFQQLEECSAAALSNDWIEALAHAFGVPAQAITDPAADIHMIAAFAKTPRVDPHAFCPIATRYAVLAMVAKLGGLKIARALSEDRLEAAVQNIILYTEADRTDNSAEERLNRLSQSLQITALTILQSHGVDPESDFPHAIEIARDGALALLQAFSRIDRMRRAPES